MGAVGIVAGHMLRRRVRSVVMLTLLVGVVGAVVLATAAGARRTGSALDRFNASSRMADAQIVVGSQATPEQLRALERVPNVVTFAVLNAFVIQVVRSPVSSPAAAVDTKLGTVIDRERIVAGREVNPSAADEITISEVLAAQLHVGVGDHLDARSFSPAQAAASVAGSFDSGPPAGPRLRLRIVGIARRPQDLSDKGAAGGSIVLTPAFNRAYADRVGSFGTALRMRTRHGAADVTSVVAAAHRIFARSAFFDGQPLSAETEGGRNAIDVLTVALWVFAGVAALAGAVAIAIVLTREISLLCVDQSNLRALGLTRGQRVAVIGPAASIIAGGGALLAVSGAAAASPLFPLGVARRAEPDLGIRVDAMVLAVGVAAVALMVLAIAFIAARRATRPSSFDRGPQTRRRPSTIVERAARLGLGPTKTSGLRMALQPGSGETAVPVRSAFLASVFGVLGLTAVLVFASSLDLLVATPQRYGWNWDFTVSDIASPSCGTDDYGLAHQKGVATLAAVCYQDVPLDGRPVVAWSFTSLRGEIGPAVVAGRSPRGLREVALGSITLHALGKRIGDTVRAGVTAQTAGTNKTVEYRIVGEIVLPNIGDPQPLADGAAFTRAAFAPLADPTDVQRHMVGRFAPGIDRAATERRVSAIPQLGQPMKPALAVEVDHLRQIGWFPATLAMLLGGLALLAVGNALVTSVRRRRHELALLKTLGFDRRQVQATIAWQATTLVTVGLVVGIPAGLIIGDLVWRHIANGLGIAAVTTFPSLALILGIPVVLALVNLIAFFPARAAAQTRPGIALRSG